MNQGEGRSKFAFETDGNHSHHPIQIEDGVEPESLWYLLCGEVSAGHVNNCFPMTFDEAIEGLATSRGLEP